MIAKLCDIAPVYFSNENHEIEYEERYGVDIDSYIVRRGSGAGKGELIITVQKVLRELQNNNGEVSGYRSAKDSDVSHAGLLDDWDMDYVFVGHVHGGEVILSFIGDFDTNEVIICFKTGDKLANMSTIKQKILDFRWRVEA